MDWTCPACAAPLHTDATPWACTGCDAPFPVFAGVPVLVPDPAGWCATYREATLAALAEADAIAPDVVDLLDAFAEVARPVEPRRFSDDWTLHEQSWPEPVVSSLTHLWAAARETSPDDVLLELLGDDRGCVLEVGCGAGTLTARLADHCGEVVAGDLSLRAVLRATRDRPVEGAVLEAEALPLAEASVDAVVAAHLVDLLDAPAAFLDEARRVLRPGGALVLSTPDPDLGPEGIEGLVAAAGLQVEALRDGIPWLRVHGPRHVEVYGVRILRARRPG